MHKCICNRFSTNLSRKPLSHISFLEQSADCIVSNNLIGLINEKSSVGQDINLSRDYVTFTSLWRYDDVTWFAILKWSHDLHVTISWTIGKRSDIWPVYILKHLRLFCDVNDESYLWLIFDDSYFMTQYSRGSSGGVRQEIFGIEWVK